MIPVASAANSLDLDIANCIMEAMIGVMIIRSKATIGFEFLSLSCPMPNIRLN